MKSRYRFRGRQRTNPGVPSSADLQKQQNPPTATGSGPRDPSPCQTHLKELHRCASRELGGLCKSLRWKGNPLLGSAGENVPSGAEPGAGWEPGRGWRRWGHQPAPGCNLSIPKGPLMLFHPFCFAAWCSHGHHRSVHWGGCPTVPAGLGRMGHAISSDVHSWMHSPARNRVPRRCWAVAESCWGWQGGGAARYVSPATWTCLVTCVCFAHTGRCVPTGTFWALHTHTHTHTPRCPITFPYPRHCLLSPCLTWGHTPQLPILPCPVSLQPGCSH